MKLLRANERWQCTLASFAMALDCSIEDLISEIGHDGGEVLWDTMPEPLRRRGFHIQEFWEPCIRRGYAPVLWMPECLHAPLIREDINPNKIDYAYQLSQKIFNSKNRFVLFGQTPFSRAHAVAYEGMLIYDSNKETVTDVANFNLKLSWACELHSILNRVCENCGAIMISNLDAFTCYNCANKIAK